VLVLNRSGTDAGQSSSPYHSTSQASQHANYLYRLKIVVMWVEVKVKVKVKQYHYRPAQAQRFPGI